MAGVIRIQTGRSGGRVNLNFAEEKFFSLPLHEKSHAFSRVLRRYGFHRDFHDFDGNKKSNSLRREKFHETFFLSNNFFFPI